MRTMLGEVSNRFLFLPGEQVGDLVATHQIYLDERFISLCTASFPASCRTILCSLKSFLIIVPPRIDYSDLFLQPTGTSPKFVNMMVQALEEFQEAHGVKLEKITKIPLEGEGTIDRRVEKCVLPISIALTFTLPHIFSRLYNSLLSNDEWMSDLHDADAIFVSTHSQGSVVSTHLLDRLIRDRHIRTSKNAAATEGLADLGVNMIPLKPQRVCCLALCGIHLGPLRYLRSSAIVQPYIQVSFPILSNITSTHIIAVF
jgi:hypothetical protein